VLGRTVGNYVVERKLGEGGMGAVYLARHPRIGKEVAIKVLLPALSRDPELVRRFFGEAKAAAEIKDAHIVDVIDFGELDDGASYIVMEWLETEPVGAVAHRAQAADAARAEDRARHRTRPLGGARARHRPSRSQARQHRAAHVVSRHLRAQRLTGAARAIRALRSRATPG
jgi:serine/threonine-protein kinase